MNTTKNILFTQKNTIKQATAQHDSTRQKTDVIYKS